MKSRKSEIALQLLLIKEKYSDKEIREAIEFLNKFDNINSIIDYFKSESKDEPKQNVSKRRKSIEEERSKAVIDIENEDKEKFKILSEIDLDLRKGKYFNNTSDLRNFGLQLSKEFTTKNDRRSLISSLLSELAKLDYEEINSIIEKVKSMSDSTESEYKQLSDYIIKGANYKNENTN